MNVVDPDGKPKVIAKRKRLRDRDILSDRDLFILSKRIQGFSSSSIGRQLNMTSRHVNRRLAAIPKAVKDHMEKLVRKYTDGDGICLIPEQALESPKRIIRRERRKNVVG